MAAKKYKQIACYVTPDQHDLLQQLSSERSVTMQVILRVAVDDVLAKYHRLPKHYDNALVGKRILGLKKGAPK